MKIFSSSSVKETKCLARKFACEILKKPREKLQGALVVGLRGDLGSGKTTFVQGFAQSLGIEDKILSPTFVIMKKFQMPNQNSKFSSLYHIDCYRIKDEQDMLELGWNKIVSDPHNLVLIEWQERIKKILPKDTVSISFETTKKHERRITFF